METNINFIKEVCIKASHLPYMSQLLNNWDIMSPKAARMQVIDSLENERIIVDKDVDTIWSKQNKSRTPIRAYN